MTEIDYTNSSDAPSVDSNDVPSIKSAWDVVKYDITAVAIRSVGAGVSFLGTMIVAELENRGITTAFFTTATIFYGIGAYRSVSDVRKTLSNLPAPKAE